MAVVVLVVVSACAGIPTSGPVTKVADDGGLGESTVRYSPAGPAADASPEQIVRGFLDAMLAFPASVRTASAFLSPDAAGSWNPARGVEVYATTEVAGRVPSTTGLDDPKGESRGAVDVRLGYRREASLDRQGHYRRRGDTASQTFTLEQVDGQWRIVNPADVLMVNEKFFTDYFRSFDLFFFDRPGRRLVPDPVYQVVGDQLATSLVTSLARGPRGRLRQAARTYVPGVADVRPSVPVSRQGVADVEFTADLTDLSDAARDHLSAQVVWTLQQVPGIESVQVVGGSTPLTAGGRAVQPVTAWGGYGPSLARDRVFAVNDDRVVELEAGRSRPLSGSWGKDARGAEVVAVSDTGVAGVLAGRDEVAVTRRDGSDARTIAGTDVIAPHWDPDGSLWLVDAPTSSATRVRVVEGRKQRTVAAPGLERLDVTGFALSPDGTRYAVTSSSDGGRIAVGFVLRDAKDRVLRLGSPHRVDTTAEGPRSASWSSPTGLGFLADSSSGVQAYEVPIDGSATTDDLTAGAQLPDVDARTLAIGSGVSPELYVVDSRDRLWFRSPGGIWRLLETGTVTGLTSGR
jgi:hypothetical protein